MRYAPWAIVALCMGAMLSAAPAAAPEILLLPAGGFEIVPGESSVTFSVPDNRGGFTGSTTQVSGRVTVEAQDGGAAYVARVQAAIDARTITTRNALRDGAMRAAYLRTGQYPTIAFAGTVTARPGLGIRPFPAAVRGRLTIRDVTREEQFSATVTALSHLYLADASTSVRMADYRIPYPRAFIFVARDPVTVMLHIVARQP